jgi:hypothetical protein
MRSVATWEVEHVTKSFRDWIGEGEQLYDAALTEFRAIESQIEALEQQLAAKRGEVNQIAQVIGKAPVDSARRVQAQVLDVEQVASAHATSVPPGNMARALSGRGPLLARP